jgi:hypothetical protein
VVLAALTIYSLIGGTMVFFVWAGLTGQLPYLFGANPERRERRRRYRQVMRCRTIRAQSAMLQEACPEDHGNGHVVLWADHKPSAVRLDLLWGLFTYTRDPS